MGAATRRLSLLPGALCMSGTLWVNPPCALALAGSQVPGCLHMCKSPLTQPKPSVIFGVSSGAKGQKITARWGWDPRPGVKRGWGPHAGEGPFRPVPAHVCPGSFQPRSRAPGRMRDESERETVGLAGGEAWGSPPAATLRCCEGK